MGGSVMGGSVMGGSVMGGPVPMLIQVPTRWKSHILNMQPATCVRTAVEGRFTRSPPEYWFALWVPAPATKVGVIARLPEGHVTRHHCSSVLVAVIARRVESLIISQLTVADRSDSQRAPSTRRHARYGCGIIVKPVSLMEAATYIVGGLIGIHVAFAWPRCAGRLLSVSVSR